MPRRGNSGGAGAGSTGVDVGGAAGDCSVLGCCVLGVADSGYARSVLGGTDSEDCSDSEDCTDSEDCGGSGTRPGHSTGGRSGPGRSDGTEVWVVVGTVVVAGKACAGVVVVGPKSEESVRTGSEYSYVGATAVVSSTGATEVVVEVVVATGISGCVFPVPAGETFSWVGPPSACTP